jgi:hypothetical protein
LCFRDKKVVGVFVRFRARVSATSTSSGASLTNSSTTTAAFTTAPRHGPHLGLLHDLLAATTSRTRFSLTYKQMMMLLQSDRLFGSSRLLVTG